MRRAGPWLAGLALAQAFAPGRAAFGEEPTDARAATDLRATTACDEGGARGPSAHLVWATSATAGEQQRVAVAHRQDGFDRNDFELSDLLPPTATAVDWRSIRGRSSHYWRVLTRFGDEWVPSATARFSPPPCKQDVILPYLPPTGATRDGTESPIPKQPEW
jgi:hypothetical protein